MKKIVIKIDRKTGSVTISPKGFSGDECVKATKDLEKKMGIIDPDREMTPDAYQTGSQNIQQGT